MLFYCGNCQLLCRQNVCHVCGKKKLRSPNNNDFCYLTEQNYALGEMLIGILQNEGIKCVGYPSGTGVRTQFALRLENLRLFVPYEFFDKAKEILDEFLHENDSERNNSDSGELND